MSHTYTPTPAPFTNILLPDDGDSLVVASVNNPFEELADALINVQNAGNLNGMLSWSGRVRVPGGANQNAYIGPIAQMIMGDQYLFSTAETAVDCTSIADNTWGYIYGYKNAGVLAFEVSTTVPAADLIFKTGNTTRRYLAAIRRGTSANIPYERFGNQVLRRRSAESSGSDPSSFTSSTYTAVALTSFMPPHARVVLANILVTSDTDADVVSARVRTPGDTSYYFHTTAKNSGVSVSFPSSYHSIVTDSSNQVEVAAIRLSGSGTTTGSLLVEGYLEQV